MSFSWPWALLALLVLPLVLAAWWLARRSRRRATVRVTSIALVAAAVAEKAGVHIDTVGVGTAAGTTIDVDGFHMFTALDEATLKSISQATGGTYHPASDASELNGIASSINLRLTVTNQPLPLAGAFIALALVLLAAGAMLTVLRTGRVI